MKDEEDRYRIAIGPQIPITNYSDDGRLWDTDFQDIESITLVLKNRETGNIEKKECVIADIKAHTYNKYPDGQKNNDLPYVAIAYTTNGIIQTGIAYRCADNNDSIAPQNVDGTVIEFATDKIDFNPDDYSLQEIIVNSK